MGKLTVGTIDVAVIIGYLVAIVGLGCWAGLRQRRGATGKDYFLAGRSLSWPLIGLALVATNISTVHLVSLAEEGYKSGLAYGNFEWMAAFTLIALALFFAPFYIRSRVATLPDFLEKRYSRGCRDWLALFNIVTAIIIHLGFPLYTGAVVMEGLFGISIYKSIFVVAILTGLYTIVGGLKAVVVTESIQTIVLLLGATLITIIGYVKVGGWEGLSGSVEPMRLTMFESADKLAGLPWYSLILGYPVIGLWYWCSEQTIVQRVLGAKDENHARVGPLFAGFIKILPVFILVLPGTICLGLINQGKLEGLSDANAKHTYAVMITQLLPPGLTGVMAAALLAALMSTVAGALNSIATLFSYDIYKRWRPETSDRSLVIVGRAVTFGAMIIAIIWAPKIAHYESIVQGINSLISYAAPPITTVFLWGVFWRRASKAAAVSTLIIGSSIGLVVALLDWNKETTGWNIPFLMTAFYLFLICSSILVLVSLWKPHQHTPESEALVWKSPLEPLRGPAWKGMGNYKFLAALLCAVIIVFYIWFK